MVIIMPSGVRVVAMGTPVNAQRYEIAKTPEMPEKNTEHAGYAER